MPGDCYVTPRSVWEELYKKFPEFRGAFDPAPVEAQFDFLSSRSTPSNIIATNPPYKLGDRFIRHALELTKPDGKVAMLFAIQFDAAKGRVDLWDYPFKARLVLTRRIRWDNLVQMEAGPSGNHCWFVWDWQHRGLPLMLWDRKNVEVDTSAITAALQLDPRLVPLL
jgi:hypothetical protein